MATPTRIENDLYDAAKAVGAVMSRSAAQQINHWARIGRELEASPGVDVRDIARVLAGSSSYDLLGEREQAVVRAEWAESLDEARLALDLAAEFEAAGVSGWVEADESGATIIHEQGRSEPSVVETPAVASAADSKRAGATRSGRSARAASVRKTAKSAKAARATRSVKFIKASGAIMTVRFVKTPGATRSSRSTTVATAVKAGGQSGRSTGAAGTAGTAATGAVVTVASKTAAQRSSP